MAQSGTSIQQENARLRALRSYGIMRTRPETPYDDLVDLAARSAGVEFAALTFIDDNSMWSKSTTHPALRERPLCDDAPCMHVLRTGEPLVVPDAWADERFRSCPLVARGPKLRFFAGTPLETTGGHVLGVLFVAAATPRERFAASDMATLAKFASLAVRLIEARPLQGGVAGQEARGDAAAQQVSANGLSERMDEDAFHPQAEPAHDKAAAASKSDPSPITFGNDDSVSLGSDQRFEALTNLIPQIVWSTTPDGYHDYFNDRWYEYTGMPRTGDQGWNWKDYLHPDDVERTLEVWHRALATGEPYNITYRFRRASDGEYRWFIGRAMPLYNAAGEIARWFGTCTDVHAERSADEKFERLAEFRRAIMSLVEDSLTAQRPEDFYQRVLERAIQVIPGAQAGSVLVRSPDGMFEFAASVGFDLEALQKVRFTEEQATYGGARSTQPVKITDFRAGLPVDQDAQRVLESAGRATEIQVSLSIPVVLDGEVAAHLNLDNFDTPDAFGNDATEMARIFAGYVATLAQRFRLERQLHRLAYHDVLTALPNRASLDDHMADAIARADESGEAVAVLFLDLDGFKAVNDTLGHRAGDEVLRVVGRRLQGCTRAGEPVARLGGDEFAVILEGAAVGPQARIVAERALAALSRPIVTQDGTVQVTCSIGIALYPADGSTAEDVLQSADKAMYVAKQRGKHTYSFFTSEFRA